MKMRFFPAIEDSNIVKKKANYTRIFKRLAYSAVMSTLLGFASKSVALDSCPQHCGQYAGSVMEVCELLRGKIDKWVSPLVYQGPNGPVTCECPCSCVVLGTQILTPSGQLPIESLHSGDEVILPLRSALPEKINSALSSPVQKHPVRKITTASGEAIVSTNHLFVTANRKVISAEKLSVGTKILDGSNHEVTVESNILIPKYTGSLHNLILRPGSRRLENHIYVANNLQSGDLVLQDANDRMDLKIRMRTRELPYIYEGKIVYPKTK